MAREQPHLLTNLFTLIISLDILCVSRDKIGNHVTFSFCLFNLIKGRLWISHLDQN